MSHRFSVKDQLPAFDIYEARRVVEALGPMPREALTAMVGYGLSDVEISRYFNIAPVTVATLRRHFGAAENR